jgi:hypothetical protein
MVAFSYQWLGLVSMIGSERGLLDFGRRCDAFGRETGWTALSLRDADEIGERKSGFGTFATC